MQVESILLDNDFDLGNEETRETTDSLQILDLKILSNTCSVLRWKNRAGDKFELWEGKSA